LNIWFDDRIFTIQQYGGISRYYSEMAAGLMARGQHVCIDAPLYINRYLANLSCHIGSCLPYFRGVTQLCQHYNGLFEVSRMHTFAPDIVHETYFREAAPAAGGALRVLTMYDLIHERFADPAGRDALSRARRASVRRSDHIICISHNTQRDLVEILGVDENRISVIHLAASLSPVSGLARPVESPYILYVGPRDRYKNFMCLLKAYASLPDVRRDFMLLCIGGGGFTDAEMQAMHGMHIPEDGVKQVSGDDRMLTACYQHAAVFVYPSLYEGFGIPPLEAMQCGCPVICADSSSLPEVVGDAAMLFDPQSPDLLAAALQQILYDSALAELFATRGMLRAAGFSWDRCVSETLTLYEKLMGCQG